MTPGEQVVHELMQVFGPSLEGRPILLAAIQGHVNGAVANERERCARIADVTREDWIAQKIREEPNAAQGPLGESGQSIAPSQSG